MSRYHKCPWFLVDVEGERKMEEEREVAVNVRGKRFAVACYCVNQEISVFSTSRDWLLSLG